MYYKARCIDGGIYEHTETVFVTARLKGHYGAQCGIRKYNDGSTKFYSYATLVAEIDSKGFFSVYCTCSSTTLRHIHWFIVQYAPALTSLTNDDFRAIQEKSIGININTGEIMQKVVK